MAAGSSGRGDGGLTAAAELLGLRRERSALVRKLIARGWPEGQARAAVWQGLRDRLLAHGRPELAAALYQEHLGTERQSAGVFYTPAYLAAYLTDLTLKPLTSRSGLRVLDPSCGAGIFLQAAAAYVPPAGLFGLDRDPEALALAAALVRSVAGGGNPHHLGIGDPGRAGAGPWLCAADALTDFPAGPGWEPGFDAVLGNPPWGADLGAAAAALTERYALARDQYDSYALFIELATGLLRPGGRLGYVVPQSLLAQPNYTALRRHLLNHYRLERLINLGDGVFRGVNQPCILLVATRRPAPDRSLYVFPGPRPADRRLLRRDGSHLPRLIAAQETAVNPDRFAANPGAVFDIWATDAEAALLARLQEQSSPWDRHVEIGRGVEIGKGGEVIRCPHCRLWNNIPLRGPDGGFRTKRCTSCRGAIGPADWDPADPETYQIIVHDQPVPGAVPFLPGEAVGRWRLGRPRWIRTGFAGIQYKDPGLYKGPKILVRKTGAGLTATLDPGGHYTSQVVFILRPRPGSALAPEYVLGLLNSRLNLWYYHCRLQDAGRNTFPYVTQTVIRSLLLKEAGPAEQAPIVAAVRELLAGGGAAAADRLDRHVARLFGLGPGERPWEG